MSYKALYRTYRPQTFSEVTGQQHIVKTIQNAINENRIAHAYLFCGPRGTGKTTVAKLFAKAVNCTGTVKPCDSCPNCMAIAKGDHPDVIEMDAASNNGVDEVRNLIETVNYAPINGQYKVYIIDEVHMMSTGAFNALLKTLEEPPAHAIFILATTEPHKVLPTIISRCQRYDFKKIDNDDIVVRLKEVLESENITYELSALTTIAKLAQGGMRDALSILEQCLAYSPNLTVASVNTVYGLLSMDNKIDFLKAILAKNIKTALALVEEMTSSSVDIKRLTYDLVDVIKDIVLYKNVNDSSIMFVLSDVEVNSIAPYITAEECFEFIDILMDTAAKYNQTLNPNMYFEIAILKLCNNVQEDTKNKLEGEYAPMKTPDSALTVIEPIVVTTQHEDVSDSGEDENIQMEPVIDNSPDLDIPAVPSYYDEQMNYESDESIQEMELSESDINVSRETFIPVEEQVELVPSESSILNILVQAKRKQMENIKERWTVINRYKFNLNTAKYATMLASGEVVAACEGAFILAYEYKVEVNQVNNSQNYHALKKFLTEVLGEEFDFIAMENSEWQNMRQHFIELKRINQLPLPGPIKMDHIQETITTEKLTEGQKMAIDLFGDIVEIEE